jgi:tungstate transport system substrate-binding protein
MPKQPIWPTFQAGKHWLALALFAWLWAGACSRLPAVLHMSTTTSVDNSGLLTEILPVFERATRIDVQIVAVGSGRALAIFESGDADVALTHDPDAERAIVDRGVTARYRKIMFNDFVIAGPPEDPARVRGSTDALAAMRQIASSKAAFASRGDASGTHAREQRLWKLAGTRPAGKALIETGSGMAATLRVASERGAYVLTDRATLLQLQGTLRLAVLDEDDAHYLNTYAVMTRAGLRGSQQENADRLYDWFAGAEARARIAAYRLLKGQPAFSVWPAAAPADHPDALPNGR